VGLTAGVAAIGPSTIDIHTDVSAELWDRYVTGHAGATVYHLAAWAGVMDRVFGHRTRFLAARRADRLVGVLPVVLFRSPLFGRFAVSMPFVNYGGIVADNATVSDALLAAAVDHARADGASYLELRHSERWFDHLPVRTHKVAMILGLQATVDDQWRVIDRKLRNQIRKAEKEGLRAAIGGVELLDAFYGVLVRNMRDLGSPVHSRQFFHDIMTTFPERTRLLTVSLGSMPIAASLVLWHGKRLEVPWASSVRPYNHLCPNVLLYWEMLKFAIQERMVEFDFGRSTPLEGTYKFKQQWGAEPRPLYWEYWLDHGAEIPDRSPKNPRFSGAISLWRHLPVPVTRAIGPLIVRNIP
jgi:FemAB-related protein (PEP-CTERM system-associated)